jgi:hypothetical protein
MRRPEQWGDGGGHHLKVTDGQFHLTTRSSTLEDLAA